MYVFFKSAVNVKTNKSQPKVHFFLTSLKNLKLNLNKSKKKKKYLRSVGRKNLTFLKGHKTFKMSK